MSFKDEKQKWNFCCSLRLLLIDPHTLVLVFQHNLHRMDIIRRLTIFSSLNAFYQCKCGHHLYNSKKSLSFVHMNKLVVSKSNENVSKNVVKDLEFFVHLLIYSMY